MVSVIIPNYNHEKYLQHRIDSVLNQIYQDFEVIILDDKSKDNSIKIIERYRDHPKVSHIIYNETNSGTTFKQWRKGVELAKGDYIWIAESDDYADVTFLEKVMNSITQNDSVLCFTGSYVIDESGNIKRENPETLVANVCDPKDFLLQHLLYENTIYNASMVVFRKDAVSDSIWFEISKFKYCGDWLFWSKILMNQDRSISEVKESLNYFRTHSSNVTGRSETDGLTFLEGFPVSVQIAKYLKIKQGTEFHKEWFDKWQQYRLYYSFPKKMSLKIMLLLGKSEPIIFFYEFKRIVLRLFGR